jgi:ABC-2 type transport system ATP-binding protein
MTMIETDNLTKCYGARRGIQNIRLSVEPGEIFGFLGPNGAGKSTAIRVLLGFLRATSGNARILGHDCWTHSTTVRRHVGYVPGDVRLYSWLTLHQALTFVGEVRNTDIKSYGRELADRFEVEPNLPVRKMSRGNRQKLALVLALAHRPQLAILDEPTSGLDPLMQNVLMDCLREMASEGRTVFFSSHTLSEVERSCSRIAMIRDGVIVACEELEELRRKAPRVVNITFNSSDAAESVAWPDFLQFQSRHGKQCEVHMQGPAAALIAWAAQQPIADVDISPPGLEAVFRRYYSGVAREIKS